MEVFRCLCLIIAVITMKTVKILKYGRKNLLLLDQNVVIIVDNHNNNYDSHEKENIPNES